jgi:hypothetical protein
MTKQTFTKVVLFTDSDGRAKFREDPVTLSESSPRAMLSPLLPSSGYQLRHSPVGFSKEFHCTPNPQYVSILGGRMQISLQDRTSMIFESGEHFHSADALPPGATSRR